MPVEMGYGMIFSHTGFFQVGHIQRNATSTYRRGAPIGHVLLDNVSLRSLEQPRITLRVRVRAYCGLITEPLRLGPSPQWLRSQWFIGSE